MLFMAATFAVPGCFYDPDLSKIADEGDTAADGGDLDAGAPSGMGGACTGQGAECEGYDADYCLLNPATPDASGICTVRGCDTKGCPDTYLCCDCSALGMEIICLPEVSAEMLGTACQCS
jgi:hypothetical protein